MGGTTPIQAYPFPTGTDRVRDGDNSIEALARAVDTNMGDALGPYGCVGLDANQGPVGTTGNVFVGGWVSRYTRGSITANTNGLVIGVAGIYEVELWARFQVSANAVVRAIIGNTANAVIAEAYAVGPLTATYNVNLTAKRVLSLPASEQLRGGFVQGTASTITMVGGATLTGMTARLLART